MPAIGGVCERQVCCQVHPGNALTDAEGRRSSGPPSAAIYNPLGKKSEASLLPFQGMESFGRHGLGTEVAEDDFVPAVV